MNSVEMIRTEDLTRVYLDGGEVWAVDEVDLLVQRGEFLALLGPSGAGKSVLLRLLAARERPSCGHILVDGRDVAALHGDALADYRREGVGYVAQPPEMVAELGALENVALPLLPYARRLPFDLPARAAQLLGAVGLGDRAAQRAGHLSAGEAERVALARALLPAPPLLLLDEPSSSLDEREGGDALALVDRLNREGGTTVILATRDPALARHADRILEMRAGQVREREAYSAWAARVG